VFIWGGTNIKVNEKEDVQLKGGNAEFESKAKEDNGRDRPRVEAAKEKRH
jgi:hypothetical protein